MLRGSRSPRAIEFSGSGKAFIILTSGQTAELLPVPGSGVSRFWVALRIAGIASRRSLFVAGDMLNRESFRQLRLWAVWGRLSDVAPPQPPAQRKAL